MIPTTARESLLMLVQKTSRSFVPLSIVPSPGFKRRTTHSCCRTGSLQPSKRRGGPSRLTCELKRSPWPGGRKPSRSISWRLSCSKSGRLDDQKLKLPPVYGRKNYLHRLRRALKLSKGLELRSARRLLCS